ncbi:MAG: hypothetical protein K0R38_3365 [Polyangiaceae bacterium]|nr:hypothetical protein [Polyangiaceae bacterium]
MNLRLVTLSSLVVASVFACGRLDLGGYADLTPPDPPPGSVIPAPVSPNGGEPSAGGVASSAESGASGQPAAEEPQAQGGAPHGREPTPNPTGGAAGELGAGGAAGAPLEEKRSCRGLEEKCGRSNWQNCCAVEYVSPGEVVRGGLKEGEPATPSHVSGFYLGVFEVTVSRFYAFLDHYDAWRASGAPRAGDGQHPLVPGSGWRPEWLRNAGDPPGSEGLGVSRAEVEDEVEECLKTPYVTDISNQPINCVSFFEAQAFCIWDGGRLPTDLEWEYAAAGGELNLPYPWGTDPPTGDHAFFKCFSEVGSPCNITPVGSHPQGKGRFGQLDLVGSVAEWTLDTVGPAYPVPCHDCANVEQVYVENPRNTRGGHWNSNPEELAVQTNRFIPAWLHLAQQGIRCAYDGPQP